MSGTPRPLIAGNWKMNGLAHATEALAAALRGAADTGCDLLVCPPATRASTVAALLAGSAVRVGGQDCAVDPHGAHTGDIAAEMLADAGATYVIVGHSERRHDHHETDATVRAKAHAAMRAGLTPIVCVGETAAERDAGRETAVVCGQIAASLPDGFAGIVAYEPVWAIGTGRTPTADDVTLVHAHARDALIGRLGEAGRAVPILYGGSVKPANAATLLRLPQVGGALVGGASLDAASFLAIARAA